MSRTNYIFVDFENVPETDWDRIADKPVKVVMVLGKGNTSLPVKLVKLIQKYPEQIQLVETELTGHNALDFILAYEVGLEVGKNPDGYFHVLSKDKGFDALIKHLKNQGILAARHDVITEIQVLHNVKERLAHVVSFYKTTKTGLPAKRKAMESHIQTLYGKTLTIKEVEETILALEREKILKFSETGAVTYL